jgi:Flp pilus assembly protein TadG
MDSNIKIVQQRRGARPLRWMNPLSGGKSPRGSNSPRSVKSPRETSSGGSVIVETALIFLVFACLLLGAFDFGQFLFVHQALVERARYAARWGAISDPTNGTAITNMVLYNAPTGSGTGYFNLTSANVFVTNPGVGTDNYVLNVQLSGYKYTRVSPYIAGSYTGPQINVSVPLGIFN